MKNEFAIALLVLVFSSVLAQKKEGNFKLSGVVTDSYTGKFLTGISVIAFSKSTGKELKGITTDEKGNFTMKDISEQIVRFKFSRMGYQTMIIDSVDLNYTSKLGIIKLTETTINFSEIVVKSIKPMIEIYADKQVLNIDRIPGNSGTVTEVLRNYGLVEIEPSSNTITIRGQSIKLQMDGHDSNMSSDILAQMPASILNQIEVILAPGAKESAEGGTYILNLISKKNTDDNYSGLISLNETTNNNFAIGLNFNYKVNNMNLFCQSYGNKSVNIYSSENERYLYNSPSMYYQKSSGQNNNNGYSGYVKLGVDYDFDQNNSITLYGTYNAYKYNLDYKESSLVNNNENIFQYNYDRIGYTDFSNTNYSFYSYYKKKFDKKGNELTLDFMYADQNNPGNTNMNLTYSNMLDRPLMQNTNKDSQSKNLVFKANYALPFETDKLEMGYNFTYRMKDNNYNVQDYLYRTLTWGDSLQLSNMFKYTENIHALYLTYAAKINNFDVKAGLRSEDLSTDGTQITQGINFTNNFLNFFPNLNISYRLNDMFQVGFNVFRRVTYPQVGYVNPFRSYIGPNYFREGNPKLEPSYLTSFAVNLSQFVNIFYTNSTGNVISAIATENDSVVVSSYVNLTNERSVGFDLMLPYNNSPMMPIHLPDFITMLNLQFHYWQKEQTGDYLNENLSVTYKSYSLQANLGLTLWFGIDANVYFNYIPKIESSLKVSSEREDLYLYFSKTIIDRKLRCSITFSDVLNSSKSDNQTKGSNIYSRNIIIPQKSRSVNFGVSYAFNDYKERRDRNLDDGRDSGNKGL